MSPEPVGPPGAGSAIQERPSPDTGPDRARTALLSAWADRLAGAPTVLEIPADQPGRDRTPTAAVPVRLSAETTRAVLDCSQAVGVTPAGLLLAAFGLALGRKTSAEVLLVGVYSPDGNLLPVRIDIDDAGAPGRFVEAVQESLTWRLTAGGVSLRQLVEQWGSTESGSRHPLVQVCFGPPDPPFEPENEEPGPRSHDGEDSPGSTVDITLRFSSDALPYSGQLDVATSGWSPAEAQSFVLDYEATVDQLARAAARDGGALGDVRGISPASLRLLESLNATDTARPACSVDELFRAEAARRPAAVAVRDAEATLTYRELAAAAAEQARLLRAAGVKDGDAVLIAVQRSVAEAVAVLGTLWAGGAYVGIDLTQPAAHTARIVAKAAPTAAIVDHDPDVITRHAVPVVSPWRPDWSVSAEPVPAAAPDPDRVAYIAFTSGSTGEPKGVAIPHRGVIRLVHRADYLMLGPDERVLRLSPLAFDASTLEIWGALLSGAALEVCPPGLVSPGELGEFIEERQVTVAWLTAGLFRLVQEIAPASLGTLRHLLSGGDVVPYEHVARALADHPGLTFTNGYGPTENTTFTTYHSVRERETVDGPLPIGTPVPGTRVYVLDRRARLLAPGAVGELYAAGEGLALGYVNDQEETDRCFGLFSPDVPERIYRTGDLVRIDQAGRIHFLGRADHQVKVRGYRIELTAISDALNAFPEVEDAVVTVVDGTAADKRLLAAVRLAPTSPATPASPGSAATPAPPVTPVDLRDRLAERFPSFMVPSLWAVVDRMPVTPNGKIDRRALAAAAAPAHAFAKKTAPRPPR